MNPSHTIAAPIFVLGAPHSGSELVALSLAHYDGRWATNDLDIRARLLEFGTLEKPSQVRHRTLPAHYSQNPNWSSDRAEVWDDVVALFGTAVAALYASKSGGRAWIDYTHNNTFYAETIERLFPNARFIHVVRDGRSAVAEALSMNSRTARATINGNRNVAADVHCRIGKETLDAIGGPLHMAERFRHSAAWIRPRQKFALACSEWKRYMIRGSTFVSRAAAPCLTLLFDQMIDDPQAAFSRLSTFLQLDRDEAPLRYFQSRLNASGAQPCRANEVWAEWTSDQKRLFVAESGTTMVRYHLMSPQDIRRIQPEG